MFEAAASGPDPAHNAWSGRHAVQIVVPKEQTIIVAFGDVHRKQTGGLGSVVLADVQLEKVPSGVATPARFESTDDGTLVAPSALGCPSSASDVRNAFSYTCLQGGICGYLLNTPFSIYLEPDLVGGTTLPKNQNGLGFEGKFAVGNYNYRWETAAVSLVGTNVHDCSATPNSSCFGSGYEQYSLAHFGSKIAMANAIGPKQVFNFGNGAISAAKALASEKYITVPLSSNDQALLAQPELTRLEFAGRPLDGTYSLFILDSPSLRWDQLEDIQILVKYRAWSPVNTTGKGP